MNNKKLLIVDDEEILARNLQLVLGNLAEKVLIAHDGLSALKVLAEEPVDCVICDVSMPKMSGVEFIRAARESGNQVPFIFYSAHGSHELMIEAARYGAFDFIRKPDLEGLEEAVARGLQEGFERRLQRNTDNRESEYQNLLNQLESGQLVKNRPDKN